MPTQSEFENVLKGFLPSGLLWPISGDASNINTLVDNIAFATKEMDDDATEEFDDIFPDNTTGYIEDWERVLELPKSQTNIVYFIAGIGKAGDPLGTTTTTQPLPSDDDERRNLILSMLDNDPLNNAAFYETLAALFGFTVTISTGILPLQWSITIDSGPPAKLAIFTAMAMFFKPAHTELTVIP